MLISVMAMLGPGFLRLWLSDPATGGKLPSLLSGQPEQPPSLSPGPSTAESGAEP